MDECEGSEFPILSYSEITANPAMVQLVQSDASGIDGYGYFCSTLAAEQTTFVAKCFPADFIFKSSHGAELTALAAYMETEAKHSCITIWLTDCMSAVFSVNKGRCFEQSDLMILDRILSAADKKKNQLIALWVPRDTNTLADYLSHLCNYSNREEVRGRIEDLADTAPRPRAAPSHSRKADSDSGDGSAIPGVVHRTAAASAPTFLRNGGRLPDVQSEKERRFNAIARQSEVASTLLLPPARLGLAGYLEQRATGINREITGVRRLQQWQQKTSAHYEYADGTNQEL